MNLYLVFFVPTTGFIQENPDHSDQGLQAGEDDRRGTGLQRAGQVERNGKQTCEWG